MSRADTVARCVVRTFMAIIPDMRTSSAGKTRMASADGRRGDFMTSLAKGLEILAAFEVGHPLGNQELVAITGLPKTTVSRITGTLASLGYLRLDEQSRKYSMGARVLGLGASVQRHIGLLRTARPHMQRLADELDIAVILGARDRTGLVFLEVIHPPRNALTINTDAGSVVPIERTSIGLAYLVAAPVPERVHMLQALRDAHPDDWEDIRGVVERAHKDYRERGFVVSQRGRGGLISGVGVPMVLGSNGVFSFACVGPSIQLSEVRLVQVLGPRLVETVSAIGQAMRATERG